MNQILITLEKVTKSYKVRKNVHKLVLKEIDLIINKGELIGIVGASGSGKTTLLNALVGNLPINSGELFFNESELNSHQDIIFVPQEPALRQYLTLKESFGDIPENLYYLIELFQMQSLIDSFPDELSSGELRRAALCKACLNSPKILVLDEPSANLDIIWKNAFIRIFEILQNKGITLVLSTHNESILQKATRVFKIENFNLIEKKL